jgi:hypothetical protein
MLSCAGGCRADAYLQSFVYGHLPRDRQRERAFEQADGSRHVLLGAQEYTHPAGIRKYVMRLGVAGGHQLVAHGFREGDVEQAVAVYMSEFPPAEAKFQGAVTVRLDLDLSPLAGRFPDSPLCPWNGHGSRYFTFFCLRRDRILTAIVVGASCLNHYLEGALSVSCEDVHNKNLILTELSLCDISRPSVAVSATPRTAASELFVPALREVASTLPRSCD